MKSSFIILLLCALIALCYSTPVPEEEAAPSRPFFDVFANANKVVMEYGKRGAETVGNFIDSTGVAVSSGITNAAHYISGGINRPFQSADEA